MGKGKDYPPLFLFTKDSMDAEKLTLGGNISPLSSVSGFTNQGRAVNIHGYWGP